jgi:hypothetical protein
MSVLCLSLFCLSSVIIPLEFSLYIIYVVKVVEARESGEDMDFLKEKLASPQSSENHKAVLDWALRWTRMLLYVTVALPDIITLQELDHMSSAEEDLGRLGCVTGRQRENIPKGGI